jgi:DNA repair protein RadC
VAQLQAALELGRRFLISSPDDRPQVRSPEDVYALLIDMGFLSQEELRTLLLDSKNRVIRIPTIFVGSVNTSVFRTGDLFREAVRAGCASVIVVHNHPSGDPSPSPEDVAVTRQIVEAGKLLNIDVLDHLIIGQTRYVSLKERGLGFPA